MERRQHPRFECFEEVNFIINDVTHTGIMLNFSKGGFFIMTSMALDPGEFIGLNYYSRATRSVVHFDCTIVRRETTGIGVQVESGRN